MVKNVAAILKQDNLDSLPYHDTMNDCFKRLKPIELEKIIQKMIICLTKRNTFNNSCVRGKYWQVLVDATTLSSFNHRHCDKCLFRRHKNGKGEVTSIEYYHYVLEAKLVIHENLVFSICTEFIENEGKIPSEEELFSKEYNEPGKDRVKQDCEIKAFYRLSEKLKAAFPRLSICITADGLYPCKQVFEICRSNNWRFIIRFKEGCIPTLYDSFSRIKASSPQGQSFSVRLNGGCLDYFYANGLAYDDFTLNFAECQDNKVKYPFLFVTDFTINQRNCEGTISFGRRRWHIENEGFKVQKNHGYYLKHVFCEDYNAMKIHYYLIQIAHAISQLLEHSCDVIKTLNLTIIQFHKELKSCFGKFVLTDDDIIVSEQPQKIRLTL
jgi:hypothetical protein